MKKSFMTRVLAVSLSAAMAFSVSSASNLMTASAASTVNLKTTFKTLKVNQKYQLKLTNNTLNWKITKVTTSNKKICTVYDKKASSVMLKGKGVGRAKIKVKVKTTKRKYPKNIKYMTCTANVKAAGEETKPPVEAAFSATVAPISSTQVRVTFNKAVDNASEAANFTVSDGVKVTKSDPSEDKLSTVLTIDGAVAGKSYDLTAKGLTVNGAAQADLTLKFTAPSDVQTGYEMTITSDPKIIKSDGQTQARVTFEVTKDGKAITTETAQIEFSASRGRFADNRATLNNGKVTVMYNAPHETVSVPAVIQATVVESSDRDMIGTTGTTSVTLSPNPDALTSEAAIITSASAGTADRVVAYFDKEVSAADFMKDGRPDASKFDCEIRSAIDNTFANTDSQGRKHNVIAILDVVNEPKALEILVDTPMTDNSNVSVKFKDKRKNGSNIDTTNTVYLKLADAREPSAMAVESTGTKKIEITFSEAVLSKKFEGASDTYAADNPANYLIDGRPLEYYGIDTGDRDSETSDVLNSELKRTSEKEIEGDESFTSRDGKVVVHSYKVDNKVGTDNRHKVTITVGSGSPLATGSHILTVKNVGDWAAYTDGARNSVSTQTFPFTVAEDAAKPAFTVNVQSPEQYVLDFTTDFRVVENSDHFTTANSATDRSTVLKLQENVNGAWTDISTSANGKNNPIRVSKVKGNGKKYIVEVNRDWSEVYDYQGTRTNYWNKQLRLHVDAGKLVNVSNNLRNDAIDIYLNANDANVTNGNIMGEVDTQSPTIVDVTQATATNGTLLNSWNVELSEPVKISSDANEEGLTPSQTQIAGVKTDAERENQGVPVAYAQFINVDNPTVTVDGIVNKEHFIDAFDTTINVEPERELTAGSWKLVVGSISDDYGATIATDSRTIEIDTTTVTTDFKIVWAAVADMKDYEDAQIGNIEAGHAQNNPANQGRFVFVKFNKPVDRATALDENNYALNNQPLPHGAYVQANIEGYDDHDNVLDSVTIVLPGDNNNLYNNYTVSSQNTQLSVSGVVAANTGEVLSNSGMNRMPYNFGQAGEGYGEGNDSQISSKNARYDATWGNAPSEQYGNGEGQIKDIRDYYQALKNALADDQYRKVQISANIFGDGNDTIAKQVFGSNRVITVNRAVDIDLGNHTIDGNLAISTNDAVGKMTIKGGTITGETTLNRKNTGTLTVDAGSVKDFVLDGVTIKAGKNDHAILLNNVWTDSFKTSQNSNISGSIYVTDADGFGFENDGWDGNLIINSNGVINLKGSFANNTIDVNQAATLNLGTIDSRNNQVTSTFISGSNTVINVKGSEAKVMITEATNAAAGKIQIKVTGKKVKIVSNDASGNTKANITSDLGGEIIWITADGKEITSDKPDAPEVTGVQAALKVVDVLGSGDKDENKIRLSDFETATVTGSAIKNEETVSVDILKDGELNTANLISDLEIKAKAELVKKGITVDASKLKVTYRLNSGNSILEEVRGVIKKKETPATNKTDTITVTLTYDGYSYTKTIKVTN